MEAGRAGLESEAVPVQPTRGLAVASAIATLAFSAAIGGVVVRRWRRAAFWLAAEVALYAVAIAAIVTGHPRLMWGGWFMALGWRIPAAIDAYRLTSRAVQIAGWRTLIGAWLVLTVGAVGLAAGVVRPFVVEAFKIPSQSMYPALIVGDHIFVGKLRRQPRRGDVVVFRYPLDPSMDYVKRVVGLPGDVVEIASGRLAVNGVALSLDRFQEDCPKGPDGSTLLDDAIPCVLSKEALDGRTYVVGTQTVLGMRSMERTVVPPDQVFVLGDNRDNSSDSRVWGPLPLENVKGIVLFIWWSSGPAGVRWDRVDEVVR